MIIIFQLKRVWAWHTVSVCSKFDWGSRNAGGGKALHNQPYNKEEIDTIAKGLGMRHSKQVAFTLKKALLFSFFLPRLNRIFRFQKKLLSIFHSRHEANNIRRQRVNIYEVDRSLWADIGELEFGAKSYEQLKDRPIIQKKF